MTTAITFACYVSGIARSEMQVLEKRWEPAKINRYNIPYLDYDWRKAITHRFDRLAAELRAGDSE